MVTNSLKLKNAFIFAALVLMVPFIAMQFTDEVNWTLFDFIVGGVLLFGLGTSLSYVWSMKKKHRLLLCAVVLFLFVLIWAELAVGIFNTRFAGS